MRLPTLLPWPRLFFPPWPQPRRALPCRYAGRLEDTGGALAASRKEAAVLRTQNDELREQNELMRRHCTELRELVTRAGIGVWRPAESTAACAVVPGY